MGRNTYQGLVIGFVAVVFAMPILVAVLLRHKEMTRNNMAQHYHDHQVADEVLAPLQEQPIALIDIPQDNQDEGVEEVFEAEDDDEEEEDEVEDETENDEEEEEAGASAWQEADISTPLVATEEVVDPAHVVFHASDEVIDVE